jgi:aspartyl-tRNA(Asn)/glutamyl-tRNA(Gln) amidotransferase subunit A
MLMAGAGVAAGMVVQPIQARRRSSGDAVPPTLAEAARAIRAGSLSSVDLTRACLARIDARNRTVNAIITPMARQALAQAAVLDAEAKAGRFRSPLHGVPIALKDNIDTADAPTTNASALLTGHVPAADARVVRQLKRAGAVIVAKANLSEFAIGSATSATSHYGPVRNPWNPDHVSGGSSGGSAAAVATGMCLGALGTDSGGSVRIPAAWCGLVGLKPTLGLVPNVGVGPGLPLIDTTGPIARTVEDVALLLDQITGYDPLDVASEDRPRVDHAAAIGRSVAQLRVGVPRRPFFEQVDDRIVRAVDAALGVIAGLVASVRDVTLNGVDIPDATFMSGDILNYHQAFFPQRSGEYQALTRAVLQTLSKELDDPAAGPPSRRVTQYIRSDAEVRRRQRTIDAAFDGFDVVVLPTMKAMPPTVKAATASEYGPPHATLASTANTLPFNILGLPALSVPCGYSREGLPIGLMIAGPHFSEPVLLALGAAYEKAAPWRGRVPG